MTKEYSDFLAHYGVKGQKHGVRRFQNEDGSLTAEGRAHYGVGDRRPESDTWSADDARYLSDEELNRRNNRMSREQNYRQNIENRRPQAAKDTQDYTKKIIVGSLAISLATMMQENYKNIAKKAWSFLKGSRGASMLRSRVKGVRLGLMMRNDLRRRRIF